MISSTLTSEIRREVEDFLQTTFPPPNRSFDEMLETLMASGRRAREAFRRDLQHDCVTIWREPEKRTK